MVDSSTQNLPDGGALQAADVIYGVRPGAPEGSRDFKFTGANVGAGGGLLDQVARDNTALNRLHIAMGQALTVGDMIDGIADVYTDETGVDLVASLNEQYNAVDDEYNNEAGAFTADLTTEAQAIENNHAGAFIDDLAYDDNSVTRWASLEVNAAVIGVSYVGQDFGAANDKVIRQVGVQQHQSIGAARLTGADAIKVQSSPDNSVWTDVVNIAPVSDATLQLFSVPASTARRYWRFLANVATSGGNAWSMNELEMREVIPAVNLSLRSQGFTALVQPDDARVMILEEDISAVVTLNTDILVFASRDDGTTWTQGTISEIGDFDATRRILVADVDLSGQPAGTTMKYRVDTVNVKEVRIHGASLMWS